MYSMTLTMTLIMFKYHHKNRTKRKMMQSAGLCLDYCFAIFLKKKKIKYFVPSLEKHNIFPEIILFK